MKLKHVRLISLLVPLFSFSFAAIAIDEQVDNLAESPRTQSFEKNGETVNRYYFLRLGDSAKSLSALFFGTVRRSEELIAINAEPWKPGMIVYYRDIENSKKDKLTSFYKARKVASETHKVTEGETLSQIAERLYGHKNNWKELADANEIEKPEGFTAGTSIRAYPQNLARYAHSPKVAANDEIPPFFRDQRASTALHKAHRTRLAMMKPKATRALASTGITSSIQRNLKTFVLGLFFLAMFIAGALLLKRRNRENLNRS